LSDLPTVYINDGFDAISFADMPTILDNLIAQKKITPVIAVFIPPVARQFEYLTEGREKFITVLCNEIVPMIDDLFRTSRTPEKRAMMGISNGGHVTLYTVLSRPDLFHNAGGQSPTISPELLDLTQRQSDKNILPPTMKIYLDCGRYDIQRYNPVWGDIDFLDANRKYSEMLSSLRIPHFFREVNDGHEWASWRERMPDMLIFFFGRFL
jgi:enterochelin esterase family protein